ncbi:hypothetical protein CGLO_13012 [Colletotrichum gloeosporioides Cg-14]|uniref:Uncharacterized protein n=1 Tax=Colletotrichum gloeosporioides (strain Cg-14) TaxID=1237896 RepID=T0L852_COLGC|nr:hypothetical protein CGLO_13012 [Colletotrichum gloeosporioides Cg-14]
MAEKNPLALITIAGDQNDNG